MQIDMKIQRDGYIKASEVQSILEVVTDALVDLINKQSSRIDSLEREVETERRMRRSMRSR